MQVLVVSNFSFVEFEDRSGLLSANLQKHNHFRLTLFSDHQMIFQVIVSEFGQAEISLHLVVASDKQFANFIKKDCFRNEFVILNA